MHIDQFNKVWVTGSSGFIGQCLVNSLRHEGHHVIPIGHNSIDALSKANLPWLRLGDLAEFDNPNLMKGVDCIFHLAGRAHIADKDTHKNQAAFMRANRDSTRALAYAAAEAGVKRFIFLSSIGVLGNNSGNCPFTEKSPISPHSVYAYSKWEAEKALLEVMEETALQVVIVRAPLVYGKNSKGSLASLLNALERGIPLPLGAIHNRRSLIGLNNLVHFLIHCMNVKDAANDTFLISDQEVISTTELVNKLHKLLKSKSPLLPIPPSLIRLTTKLLGRSDLSEKLLSNLEIDSTYARTHLKWKQPHTQEDGLASLSRDSKIND